MNAFPDITTADPINPFSVPVLHAAAARSIRHATGIPRPRVAACTRIPETRLAEIERKRAPCEPWLDELIRLATFYGLDHIAPLLGAGVKPSGHLTHSDALLAWRRGDRLSLTYGLILADLFHLHDPIQLQQSSNARQLWDMVALGERGRDAGRCPVCDTPAGVAHLDTCYGDRLFGPPPPLDRIPPVEDETGSPYGRNAVPSEGRPARGLKTIRQALRWTQKQMAERLDISTAYVSVLERQAATMGATLSERIALTLGCDRALLFQADIPDRDLAAIIATEQARRDALTDLDEIRRSRPRLSR